MKPSFFKSAPQKTWDSKKKSPVYLKGVAVQSRNHLSVTIKFKFIKKLKRLPFSKRMTDFVQIFCWLLFLKLFQMSPLSSKSERVGEHF